MIKEEYKYSAITARIIGASFEVHKILGMGFPEVIYQRALEHAFSRQGLSFERECQIPVFYKDKQIGYRKVDFLVENVISVELKATSGLDENHLAQAINYLEAYNLEIGMLINFGAKSLEYKRIINSRFKQ